MESPSSCNRSTLMNTGMPRTNSGGCRSSLHPLTRAANCSRSPDKPRSIQPRNVASQGRRMAWGKFGQVKSKGATWGGRQLLIWRPFSPAVAVPTQEDLVQQLPIIKARPRKNTCWSSGSSKTDISDRLASIGFGKHFNAISVQKKGALHCPSVCSCARGAGDGWSPAAHSALIGLCGPGIHQQLLQICLLCGCHHRGPAIATTDLPLLTSSAGLLAFRPLRFSSCRGRREATSEDASI